MCLAKSSNRHCDLRTHEMGNYQVWTQCLKGPQIQWISVSQHQHNQHIHFRSWDQYRTVSPCFGRVLDMQPEQLYPYEPILSSGGAKAISEHSESEDVLHIEFGKVFGNMMKIWNMNQYESLTIKYEYRSFVTSEACIQNKLPLNTWIRSAEFLPTSSSLEIAVTVSVARFNFLQAWKENRMVETKSSWRILKIDVRWNRHKVTRTPFDQNRMLPTWGELVTTLAQSCSKTWQRKSESTVSRNTLRHSLTLHIIPKYPNASNAMISGSHLITCWAEMHALTNNTNNTSQYKHALKQWENNVRFRWISRDFMHWDVSVVNHFTEGSHLPFSTCFCLSIRDCC